VGAQDITVTDLGYIDLGSDGLVASNDVGLYDDIGNLLSQGTVLSGGASPLIGFFRYAPITPITLTSGQIYRVAGSFRQSFDPYTGVGTGFNVDPAINYLDTVFASSSTLAFPDQTTSIFLGGNIQFTTTPVPFEFNPIVGLGILGGLLAVKRFVKNKKAS